MRIPRGKITIVGGIERAVAAGALRVSGLGGVLVLLDADDDCPAEYGPLLLARAQAARPDKQVSVVLANREFEAWFLAAAPSLAGQFGFPAEFARPQNPETPCSCRGILGGVVPGPQLVHARELDDHDALFGWPLALGDRRLGGQDEVTAAVVR
jgi:hypothetical protein